MAIGSVKLGMADQGRKMSAAEFEAAEFDEGYLYELARGRLIVSNVPRPAHLRQVSHLRNELALFHARHPALIYAMEAGRSA